MKLYKILLGIDGVPKDIIKYIFADNMEEAINIIKDKYFNLLSFITFINVQEIEIRKGILF